MQNQSEDWQIWDKLRAHNRTQHQFFEADEPIRDEYLWIRLANLVQQLESHPAEKRIEDYPIADYVDRTGPGDSDRQASITRWDPSEERFYGVDEDGGDVSIPKYDITTITHPGGSDDPNPDSGGEQLNSDGTPARGTETLGGIGETSMGGGADGSSVDPVGGVSIQPDPDSLARLRGKDSPIKR